MRDRLGPAALALSVVALVMSTAGVSIAGHSKPRPVVRLDKKGKIPVRVLPKVPRSRNSDRLGGRSAGDLALQCDEVSVDMGTWCLMSAPYAVTPDEVGKNDYFFATQKCADMGGYLPTAAQLIGAAARLKLASTIGDNATSASIDEDPTDGTKDRREMSATLVTTAAGSSAAGSEGVSEGSRGDPRQGEPDPVPQPANPSPDTLQYVTVYDNAEHGGFAGSKAVGQPELFRCAFDKQQGAAASDVGP